jgi:hypothetical protein
MKRFDWYRACFYMTVVWTAIILLFIRASQGNWASGEQLCWFLLWIGAWAAMRFTEDPQEEIGYKPPPERPYRPAVPPPAPPGKR